MPTPTERAILQRRRAAKTGDILVPILERLLEHEVIPEDDEDFRFMDMLVRVRALPRRKGVFSPSMLGSCMRQAYFAKRNVEKHSTTSSQTNGYFLKGNFVHFQWQFACWKAHKAGLLELVKVPIADEIEILKDLRLSGNLSLDEFDAWVSAINFWGDGTRPGVEVRVIDGDFGGTIDVLVKIMRLIYVVDFKGINLIDFQRTVKKGAKQEYRKQIVGYSGIANRVLNLDIQSALLVSESKAGPISGSGSPIALHETKVNLAEYDSEVKRRLKTLRWYDTRNETPEPECVSTVHMSYQECPFNRFCHAEVRQIQREREQRARAKPRNDLKVARPNR